jgi:LPXTG-motif cell wall-anchored protein
MRDHAAGGTVFDKGLTAAFGTIAAFTDNGNAQDDSYVWDGCENWMDARDTTNFYQGYNFGYTMGFQLARTDSDVTVSKTDAASGAALSGATFNLYRMVNGAKEYLTDTAGALAWTADQTAATVFTAGSFTVKSLPFGTYYLSELTAPSGYDKRTSDAEIVVDKTAKTFAITNSQTPSGGGDDDDDDTPVPPVKPEEPTVIPETPTPEAPAPVTPATEIPEPAAPLAEVPKTGDASALWLALAGISGISLAAVSLRKKRDGE